MSTLSKLFDHLNKSLAGEEPGSPPDTAEPTAPYQPASERWVDLGFEVGGDNESLRNLLIDVGRRIDALDDLRDIFGELVVPIGQALNTLERETLDNANLRSTVDEITASHEALRNETRQLSRKLAASESECEQLRHEVGAAQQAAAALEAHTIELTTELEPARARISELEDALARESAAVRMLSDHKQSLSRHAAAADKRIAELEGLLGSTNEKLVLREDENRSLQTSLDQIVEENSRLHRRLTESEITVEKTWGQLGQLQTTLKATEAERSRLAGAVAEANDKRQIESNTLSTRLEAMSSRAITAEKLLADVRQNLLARTEENSAAERKVVEATLARNLTDKKLELVQNALQTKERQLQELDQSRSKLSERANTLMITVKQRDKALARAEEQIKALTARIDQLEAEVDANRNKAAESIAGLKSQLENERAGRTVAEGALKKARLSYADLPPDFDDYARQNRAGSGKGQARDKDRTRHSARDLPLLRGQIRTAPEDFGPVEDEEAPTA
jgi:crescentin